MTALSERAAGMTQRASRVAERANRPFLPEIQALRAVAVLLVVLYHYWPGQIPGGYVGVDAFFVISGYLITSHLLREVDLTGTVRLTAFYARRARRLLPASIVVLLVVALAVFLFLPAGQWSSIARELIASGFYVQNLWLASKAVTYSASNDLASPVQHYWSLSAEEQFYLVWPSLIIIACLVARRWPRGRTTTNVALTLILVTLGSFAISVWATQTNRAAAYFITPARAWEFGAGALVVLLMRIWVPATPVALLLRWLGLAGLLGSAWLFSAATPFPGEAAMLPVFATSAIILAGDTGRADPSRFVFRLGPVQWLGDASYSIYLWHWPMLVFAPYLMHHNLSTPELLALALLCLFVSGVSRRFVEDGLRFWPRLVRTPRATLLAAGAAMAMVALVAGTQDHVAAVRERQTQALLDEVAGSPCFGAPAMENRARCPTALTALPVAAVTKADAPWAPDAGCKEVGSEISVLKCYWGKGVPARVVALVGDSHAEHWRAALHRIAKARNWQIVEVFAGGCPATYARSVVFEEHARDGNSCPGWTAKATAELKAVKPDDIVTAAYVQRNVFEPPDSGGEGFVKVWRQWLGFSRVTVLRDIPTTAGRNGSQCLAVNQRRQLACSNPRSKVLVDDDMMRAARPMAGEVNLVDLSDYFCDSHICYAVIGGASVYYDVDHMSNQFSATLAEVLLRRMPAT